MKLATAKLVAGAVAGAASGFVAGGIISGTLKGAVKGAAAGAITGFASAYANAGSVDGWLDAGRRTLISSTGGCLAAEASGGKCGKGARLAGLAQALRVGMEMYSEHKPTWSTADGEAVVKAKSDMGVHDPNASNVGVSIEVDTIEFPELKDLVGRKLSSLKQSEVNLLNNAMSEGGARAINEGLVSWNSSTNEVQYALTTERHLGILGQTVPGFNSMAVFHDYWMAHQNVTNFAYLAGTIFVAVPINYTALGLDYYSYLYRNNR